MAESKPDLDALEVLLAGDVSPAPWHVHPRNPDEVVHGDPVDMRDAWDVCTTAGSSSDGDARLIAALRNAAPDLVAEAREAARLRAEVERLRAAMYEARAEQCDGPCGCCERADEVLVAALEAKP